MLQPIYHVISSFYPVAPNATFKKGMLIGLDATGQAVAHGTGTSSTAVGLAGDDKGSLTAGQLTNRVSDMGNQTYASGEVTVYNNGGEFIVDINQGGGDASFPAGDVVSDATVAIGDKLAASATPGVLTVNGSATPGGTGANELIAVVVGDLSGDAGKLPTGIPGEYAPSGDSDNPRKFARIKLVI